MDVNDWGGLQQYLPLAVLKLRQSVLALYLGYLQLQQYLPLAVLKPHFTNIDTVDIPRLQQYLPLAVLKPYTDLWAICEYDISCNSTYRLRY